MSLYKGKEFYLRTIVYILAAILFFTIWRVLGPGTAFIGATIAKGSLVLINTDLTGNKLRSTITFFLVFVYIGLFSFIASLNIYLGLIVNFISIFILSYNFVSNIKQFIWRPFVLGYLYLLIEPGTLEKLPIRLVVLGLGSLFLLLSQMIVNKNKSNKNLDKNINELLDKIISKIDFIIDGKELVDNKLKVNENVNEIVSTIYNKRIDPLFITKKDNIFLNITLYIERLNYLLKEINIDLHNDIELEFIVSLRGLIEKVKKDIFSEKPRKDLINIIEEFIKSHKEGAKDDYYLYEILQNLSMLKNNLEDTDYKKRDILFNRRLRKDISSVFTFKISRDSIRFSFAFRAAFLLAVSYFIVNLFSIQEGKWIVFTIYAVIEPFFENTKKRFPKRFKGTLLGIILFVLVYVFIKNIYVEGAVFIGMYYLYVISKDFQIRTMCTATVSLGLFAIVTKEPVHGIAYRLGFVVLGIVIGYLGTKYIMPYNIKDAIKSLVNNYYKLSKEILEFSISSVSDDYYYKVLSEKVILSKLYESKIISNNAILKNDKISDFIYNQRILNNTIYFTIFFFKNNGVNEKILNGINYNINEKEEEEILRKIKEHFKKEFQNLWTNEEKLAFMNIQRIVIRLDKSERLKDSIITTIE
ncbi:FUSC family protein [uncultured Clostridium sp.]|uniref:FUSC family protein n=1 Tax=uncultured Clostridium sp. TaxID=59620 RepID=UPI00260D52E8|nr:FUSC family protein [uncultured Clostridium sp.]